MNPASEPLADGAKPKHTVIVAHPDPDSFTMSVARAYCAEVERQGQAALLRDLYRMDFDPVLKDAERPSRPSFTIAPDVEAELDRLSGSDVFVLVYPIWFGAPPAMIKGYVERVFGAGFAGPASGAHLLKPSHPLLGGKRLLSFTASGSTKEWLSDQGAWQSLQTLFDGYLARTFWMRSPEHVHFESIVEGIEEGVVRAHLAEVRAQATTFCARLAREIASESRKA